MADLKAALNVITKFDRNGEVGLYVTRLVREMIIAYHDASTPEPGSDITRESVKEAFALWARQAGMEHIFTPHERAAILAVLFRDDAPAPEPEAEKAKPNNWKVEAGTIVTRATSDSDMPWAVLSLHGGFATIRCNADARVNIARKADLTVTTPAIVERDDYVGIDVPYGVAFSGWKGIVVEVHKAAIAPIGVRFSGGTGSFARADITILMKGQP